MAVDGIMNQLKLPQTEAVFERFMFGPAGGKTNPEKDQGHTQQLERRQAFFEP